VKHPIPFFMLFYHRSTKITGVPGAKSAAGTFPQPKGFRAQQMILKMGNHNFSRRICYCQSTALSRSAFLAFPAIIPMCFGDQWDLTRENGETIILVSSVDRFASV
jgi:hypothetical protein